MPVQVDHEQRRQQIIDAAILEIGESGIERFALKNVGRRLGGSVTMVTHYFTSRSELFAALLEQMVRDSDEACTQLEQISDPRRRLSEIVDFFVPATTDAIALERARIAVSSHAMSNPETHSFFQRLDPTMRAVIRTGIRDLVPASELETAVDLVRIWTSGLVLLMIERTDYWDEARRDRVLAMMSRSLESLGFDLSTLN